MFLPTKTRSDSSQIKASSHPAICIHIFFKIYSFMSPSSGQVDVSKLFCIRYIQNSFQSAVKNFMITISFLSFPDIQFHLFLLYVWNHSYIFNLIEYLSVFMCVRILMKNNACFYCITVLCYWNKLKILFFLPLPLTTIGWIKNIIFWSGTFNIFHESIDGYIYIFFIVD